MGWLSSIEKWWNNMWNTDELADEHPGWVRDCLFYRRMCRKEWGYSGYASNNHWKMKADTNPKILRMSFWHSIFVFWGLTLDIWAWQAGNTQSPTTHIYAKFGSKTDGSLVIFFKKSFNRTASLPKKSIEIRSGPTGDELLHASSKKWPNFDPQIVRPFFEWHQFLSHRHATNVWPKKKVDSVRWSQGWWLIRLPSGKLT